MTAIGRARRGWIIGFAGIVVGALLIALRNPHSLSENPGVLLIFGITCWLFSLLRPKWGALIFGGAAIGITLLGYNAMQSPDEGQTLAGVMFLLIGVQTGMATLVSVVGNLLLDWIAQMRSRDQA